MPEQFSEFQKLIIENPSQCRFTWILEKTPAWVKLPGEPESIYSSGYAFAYSYSAHANSTSAPVRVGLNVFSKFVHYMPNTRRFVGTVLAYISTPTFTKGYGEK